LPRRQPPARRARPADPRSRPLAGDEGLPAAGRRPRGPHLGRLPASRGGGRRLRRRLGRDSRCPRCGPGAGAVGPPAIPHAVEAGGPVSVPRGSGRFNTRRC
jgi:hypothetical protein